MQLLLPHVHSSNEKSQQGDDTQHQANHSTYDENVGVVSGGIVGIRDAAVSG